MGRGLRVVAGGLLALMTAGVVAQLAEGAFVLLVALVLVGLPWSALGMAGWLSEDNFALALLPAAAGAALNCYLLTRVLARVRASRDV